MTALVGAVKKDASRLAYIGIGSNVGDKLGFCQKAISLLCSHDVALTAVSSLYETEPTDYLHQEWFYNAVAAISTTLSPILLLQRCQEIELSLGKNIEIPKGPRTIDLDILFYQDAVIHASGLIVPHPSALSRLFVLIPMTEIAPDFIVPDSQQTMKAILETIWEGPAVRKKQGPDWVNG